MGSADSPNDHHAANHYKTSLLKNNGEETGTKDEPSLHPFRCLTTPLWFAFAGTGPFES